MPHFRRGDSYDIDAGINPMKLKTYITFVIIHLSIITGCSGCAYFADRDYEKVAGLIDSERYSEAVALATDSINRYPDDARFYYERGYCLIRSDIAAAKNDFTTALKIDPRYYNAYYGLSIVHRKEKLYDLAEANILKAIELAPDGERKAAFFGGLAALYGNKKDYGRAIEYCKKSIALDDRGESHYRLGIFYYNHGRKKEAEKTWITALAEKEFKQIEFRHLTYSELAQYYYRNRKFGKAKEKIDKALELAPGSTEYRDLLDKIKARIK